MDRPKFSFKYRRPSLLQVLLAVMLALLIVDRAAAYLHRPHPESKDIVLYTTDWCPYCESLRLYLKAYRIPYREHDVEKSLSGVLGFWALRAKGVPVSVIGEEVVYGYNMEKIDGALRKLGYSIAVADKEIQTTEGTEHTENLF